MFYICQYQLKVEIRLPVQKISHVDLQIKNVKKLIEIFCTCTKKNYLDS